MVIIDTSAWVSFFRRDGDPLVKLSVKALVESLEGAICGPVELEFFGGARRHELKKIESWFNLIPYIPNDQKLWRKAAKNFATLRGEGFTLPWNDVLIATIALESDHWAYAEDKHFQTMAEVLGLKIYRPGYNGQFNPNYG